jgi:hypothetical protein
VDLKASGAKWRTQVLAAAVAGFIFPSIWTGLSSAQLSMRARALLEILL